MGRVTKKYKTNTTLSTKDEVIEMPDDDPQEKQSLIITADQVGNDEVVNYEVHNHEVHNHEDVNNEIVNDEIVNEDIVNEESVDNVVRNDEVRNDEEYDDELNPVDHSVLHAKDAHEALKKLRSLPEPMAEKRARKLAIKALPKERIESWKTRLYDFRNAIEMKKYSLKHRIRGIIAFQNSLRQIEVRCGTSTVNVFLFVKWTLFLNVTISLMIILCIIIPYFVTYLSGPTIDLETSCTKPNQTFYTDIEDRIHCCTKSYYDIAAVKTRGSLGYLFRVIFQTKSKTVEHTLFFYGYYMRVPEEFNGVDFFAALYVAIFAMIMLFCLALMVKNVGVGVEKLIIAGEGDFYKYSNLIFSGWDHYTRDVAGANFKHKILSHELSIALKTEKTTLAAVMRNRREKLFINFKRVCVNVIVLIMTALAGWIIFSVAGQSMIPPRNFDSLKPSEHLRNQVISFAPSIVISFMNLIFPTILSKLGKWEEFSPEKETALVLIRALTIRLSSIGFVAFKFYTNAYCELKHPNYCIKCAQGSDTKERITCWESLFADQIYKLMLVDLILKLTLTFIVDPLRKLMKKQCEHWIFKKLGTMKFNVVRHSLDMIYLQVLSWVGMYFGPTVPLFAVFYSYIVFYIKKYSVLFNCTAVPDTFKTMRTTTIFVGAKLLSYVVVLFVNVGVIGYMTPSRGCGPFRQFDKPWQALYNVIKLWEWAGDAYDSIASPGVTTPIVICLLIVCYYFFSVAMANREMVDTLRHLLIVEGHDKQYLFARLNGLRAQAEDAMKKRKENDDSKRLLRMQVENLNKKLEKQKLDQESKVSSRKSRRKSRFLSMNL